MINNKILLYFTTILIFLLCTKNYLFKNSAMENFTANQCIISNPEPEPEPTFMSNTQNVNANVNLNIFSNTSPSPTSPPTIPIITQPPNISLGNSQTTQANTQATTQANSQATTQANAQATNQANSQATTQANAQVTTTSVTNPSTTPVVTSDCSCGNTVVDSNDTSSIGTCIRQHTNNCLGASNQWRQDTQCGNNETHEQSALSETSGCHQNVSSFWNNIETLHQLSQNIAHVQCPYNFSDQDDLRRRRDFFRNNIPCNELPQCENNACIETPGNANPVNPQPITCTPKNLCEDNQYISNYTNTNTSQQFTCEDITDCQPGTYVASDPFSRQILNQTQNTSNRVCQPCASNQYSTNINSSQCTNLDSINPNQIIIEDAEYYISNGQKFFVSDRLLTSVFYNNSGQPRVIKIIDGRSESVLEKHSTANYWQMSPGPGFFIKMIHASPNNKELIRTHLNQHSNFSTTTQSDFDNFYNTNMVSTIDYPNNRKRDYYKWIIIIAYPAEQDNLSRLFLLNTNITANFHNNTQVLTNSSNTTKFTSLSTSSDITFTSEILLE